MASTGGSIVYVDRSRIRPGRRQELRRAVQEVVDLIDAREPRLLCYGFAIDEAADEMTVVAVHPDADSLVTHLDVGAAAFGGLADLIDLQRIDVYGSPGEPALQRLEEKARALGAHGQVSVHPIHAGFSRVGADPGLR